MSALARLFHRTPATRRSYSSFFSSKPGGGRYFNSSKPPKSPVVTAKSRKSDPSSSDRGPEDTSTASTSAPANAASSTNTTSPTPSSDPVSSDASHNATAHRFVNGGALHSSPNPQLVVHPKDFKMHQFFALHRPLLLLSNPPSVFASPPAATPLFRSSYEGGAVEDNKLAAPPFANVNLDGTFPSAYAAGVDGDAEAARQLHHAMTMNRVGAVVSWEEALQRLGLDVSTEAERVHLQAQWEREWEEVMLDSVKRKRRKKMRKHKLKKLRRATRSQRMRMGK